MILCDRNQGFLEKRIKRSTKDFFLEFIRMFMFEKGLLN